MKMWIATDGVEAGLKTDLRGWWCRALARGGGWGTTGVPFLPQLYQSLKCLLFSPAVVSTTLTGIEVCGLEATINELQHGNSLCLWVKDGARFEHFVYRSLFTSEKRAFEENLKTVLKNPTVTSIQNSKWNSYSFHWKEWRHNCYLYNNIH